VDDALSVSKAKVLSAHFPFEQLLEHARQKASTCLFGYYWVSNTIEVDQEEHPRQPSMKSACALTWWNAMAILSHTVRTSADGGDLRHIGSFVLLASLFGAVQPLWHAESESHGGDCLYTGHVSPGVYARPT
jgi:pyruvate dehydrogenase E1 component